MKIYFTASISGKKLYGMEYKTIIEILRSLGHEVLTMLDLDKDFDKRLEETLEQRELAHKKIMQMITQSDLTIAETSFQSVSVGYELTTAIDKEKPVLVLHTEKRVPVLLLGATYDKLRVVEYSLDNLKKNLGMYISELGDTVDTRFNFFISPKISTYLDWISKEKRVPRAVYLRRLIEADMKKNRMVES